MKLFVDTNIFLDLVLQRDSFDEALFVFNTLEKRVFTGVVSDITILNIDYIAKKQVKDIRHFLELVNSVFEVVGADNNTIQKAIEIDNRDLEDNLQYILAKKHNCELIISNDQGFYAKDIEIVSSVKFVEQYL